MAPKNIDDDLLSPQASEPLRIQQSFLKQTKSRSSWPWVIALVVLAAFGAWAWYYQNHKGADTTKPTTQSSTSASGEVTPEVVIGKLKKHIMVPENEQPTIAKVVDVEKLRTQFPFYEKAKNGDLLVVYGSWAVIYDYDADVIVNVAALQPDKTKASSTPVATGQTPAASTSTTTTTQASPLSLEIRNGSGTSGLAGKIATELKPNTGINVTKVGNAANSNYSAAVLVDLTGGNNQEAIKALAAKYGATVVTSLPTGESSASAAAILILSKANVK